MTPLEQRVEELPLRPGVYLFRDASGRVLYVGKAKVLRDRVRQYVRGHDERFMVRFLVAQAAGVDVVLTETEKEALILENTLIKQYRPQYNVKLRDDKNFLHLRVDTSEAWPRFTLVRRIRADGARYFGPYSSASRARSTLEFLQRSFPLRTCSDSMLRSRTRPCLLHQMKRCVAPCVAGYTTEAEYREILNHTLLFLENRDQDLLRSLHERMIASAEAEAYEEAARLRDLTRVITATLEKQQVMDRKLEDRDVWGFFQEGDRGVAAVVPIREGRMLEPEYVELRQAPEPRPEQLSSLLNTFYDGEGFIPPEILLPELPSESEALLEVLRERRKGRVRLAVPERGEKARLLRLADDNARDRYRRHSDEAERRMLALDALSRRLGLEGPPHRIECFDNSNLQGTQPVASCVVFIDGAPAKQHYRHYHLRNPEGSDDYASMAEVLGRRFRRAAEEGLFPDLLVVDGGRGQLNVALGILAELGFGEQRVVGLAKPRTEHRKGEDDAVDKIVIPGQEELLRLPDNDPALNLLRHLRDEAHRFAITFQRKVRRKSALASVLEAIDGVGPARRKALLKHFGSAKAVLAASLAELAEVEGVGMGTAGRIYGALHPEGEVPGIDC